MPFKLRRPKMDYVCPTCNNTMPRELLQIINHTELHIIEVIKKKHPEWAEGDGICKKCYEYYKKQLQA